MNIELVIRMADIHSRLQFLPSHRTGKNPNHNCFCVTIYFATNRFTFEKHSPLPPLLHLNDCYCSFVLLNRSVQFILFLSSPIFCLFVTEEKSIFKVKLTCLGFCQYGGMVEKNEHVLKP